MALYCIISSVIILSINFFYKVTIDSAFEIRVIYVLCLIILITPIITQLSNRRIQKTLLILLIILSTIVGFTGISVSLFISVPIHYFAISWGLFLSALALQNCSIFYHSFRFFKFNSNIVKPDTYKLGLIILLIGLIAEFAVIYPLKYDIYIYSAIGMIGQVIAILGCLTMGSVSTIPKSNVG